jgi:hypothetical protein
MDEQEGARRELIQTVRHGVNLSRQNVVINGKMADAFEARQGGVTVLPVDVLRDYAGVLRGEAESCLRLAAVIEGEIASRQ